MSSRLINSKYLYLYVIGILIIGIAGFSRPANAQTADLINAGFGTASIDGHFGDNEWGNAAVINFIANTPEGSTPAALYIMSDEVNLYLAVSVERPSLDSYTHLRYLFDHHNDGIGGHGDDFLAVYRNRYGSGFTDAFWSNTQNPPSLTFADTAYGGTTDGFGEVDHTGGISVLEISHPLNSADDEHDLNLVGGDEVGMTLTLYISNPSGSASTRLPLYPVKFLGIRIPGVNHPPIAEPNSPYSGQEGFPISLDGTGSYDPDGDPLSYHWTVQSEICQFSNPNSATPTIICDDNGVFTSILTVDDGRATDWDTAQIKVDNLPPSVGGMSVGPLVSAVGTQINTDADFSDRGSEDTHTALWDWGDGTQSEPTRLNQEPGNGEAFGSHTYTSAGIYTIMLTVTDDDGDSGTSAYQNVVVYDPGGGFVTGGGWIWSWAGTYVPEPDVAGWANFGFVVRYHKGAEVPDGQAELVYHTAGMNFHSTEYDWLVVTGDDKAKFKGRGTLNGEGDYRFMIWAGDGEPDTFRIKIWEEISGGELVVYDNSLANSTFENGQPIGKGSIVIHAPKKTPAEVLDQYQTGINYGFWFDNEMLRWQEFIQTGDNLSAVEVYLKKNGNPGNVYAEIRNSENVILGQEMVSGENILGSGWVRFEFSDQISLTPGMKYKLYIFGDQDTLFADDIYFWRGNSASTYCTECDNDVKSGWPDYAYAFRTFSIMY